ncbi:hypothetical protein HUG17_2046 [Dermatophagoides farinae]|uniref:Piwi domain-containing protein n=1 Tax=Dermatophagoides farinae TaxID=6954 RepID=A0A9D4SLP2_DERFA|nr:hypothetical protein HUG17_2046 [Dermatophagoides farinae]
MNKSEDNNNGIESTFTVKLNYFPLHFSPIVIYKYDVQITPPINREEVSFKIIMQYMKQNSPTFFGCYYEDGFIYSRRSIFPNQIRRNNIVNFNNRYIISLKNSGKFYSLNEAGLNLEKFFHFLILKNKKITNTDIFIQKEYPFPEDGISIIAGFRISITEMPESLIIVSKQTIIYDGKTQASLRPFELPEEANKAFSKELNCSPEEEYEFINECRKEIAECADSFGIKIDPKPLETNGSILCHPKMIPDSPNKPFYIKPSGTINMAILSFVPFDSEKMKEFETKFIEKTKFFGINLEKRFETQLVDVQNASEIDTVFQNLNIRDINFVLIGLSAHSRMDYIFEKVKSYATSCHGVVTQVFLTENFLLNDTMPEFFNSLAIKSCLKLGGQPNIIDPRYWNAFSFDPESTMMVGVSYYQFKLDNIGKNLFSHSIVASMDANFCQNISIERVSVKPNDKKLYKEIFQNLLKEYHKEHDIYPENIIVFHEKKYIDLKSVAESINKKVKVTSLLIDKNSPIRLFKNNGEKVPIGTSVNLDFQHLNRLEKEFVISAEIGAEAKRYKSIKYKIIIDDSKMPEDHIKHLCYSMCHFYFENFYINDAPFPLELAHQFAKKAARRCIGRNEINKVDSIEEIIDNFSQMVRVHDNLEYSVDE